MNGGESNPAGGQHSVWGLRDAPTDCGLSTMKVRLGSRIRFLQLSRKPLSYSWQRSGDAWHLLWSVVCVVCDWCRSSQWLRGCGCPCSHLDLRSKWKKGLCAYSNCRHWQPLLGDESPCDCGFRLWPITNLMEQWNDTMISTNSLVCCLKYPVLVACPPCSFGLPVNDKCASLRREVC